MYGYHWAKHWTALMSFWKNRRTLLKKLALAGVFKILRKYGTYVLQVWRAFGMVLRVALPMAQSATTDPPDEHKKYARRLYQHHKRLLDPGDDVSSKPLLRIVCCSASRSPLVRSWVQPVWAQSVQFPVCLSCHMHRTHNILFLWAHAGCTNDRTKGEREAEEQTIRRRGLELTSSPESKRRLWCW